MKLSTTPRPVHDRVISALAAFYRGSYEVKVNPGPAKDWGIDMGEQTVFPDVMLCTLGTRVVEFLIEVETADSVDDEEAEQWETYSSIPAVHFRLLVPNTKLSLARSICRRKGIPAGFGYWWKGRDGRIGFRWTPPRRPS